MLVEEKQTVTIASQLSNIPVVEKFIEEVCQESSINTVIYANIMIAVLEAVNNAIIHGNKFDPTKKVHIDMTIKQQMISFIIEDEGQGFNFQNIPDPTKKENIVKEGGRGLFLMKNLADKVIFHEGGKKVELLFNNLKS